MSGLDAQLYWPCDVCQTQSLLQQELAETTDNETTADALSRLGEAKPIVHIDKKFLSLPVQRNHPAADMEIEIDVRQSMPASANSDTLLRIL